MASFVAAPRACFKYCIAETFPLIVLLILAIMTSTCRGKEYQFLPVANTTATGGLGFSVPSINDDAVVAFVDTTPGHVGVFTGNGGPLATVATSAEYDFPYFAGISQSPSINASGSVAFFADLAVGAFMDEPGIVLANSGGLSTVISGVPPVGDPQGFSYSTNPALDDADNVGFTVGHVGGWQGTGVYLTAGITRTDIQEDASSAAAHSLAVSDSGILAYQWTVGGAGPLFLLESGTTTSFGGGIVPYSSVDVNDAAMVAVVDTQAIRTGTVAGLDLFVDTSTDFAAFEAVSINNPGSIAYLGIGTDTLRGIYTGPRRLDDKVIRVGDLLDGSTVIGINYGRDGLNDSGQIAFWAALGDGRQGIYIANPVPEPSSYLLCAIGIVGVVRFWRPLRAMK